jgi:exopolyphosphatase/guanosine-5'-triphosphate,3'-diphosphate pyrophosphatase
VTTIAGVHLDLRRYDRSRVDGCWMTAEEINGVIERLLAMDYQQRKESPCIGPERADLVMAGCAILEAIRRAFPVKRLRVADRGLREGMLVQMMRDDGVWDNARGAGP